MVENMSHLCNTNVKPHRNEMNITKTSSKLDYSKHFHTDLKPNKNSTYLEKLTHSAKSYTNEELELLNPDFEIQFQKEMDRNVYIGPYDEVIKEEEFFNGVDNPYNQLVLPEGFQYDEQYIQKINESFQLQYYENTSTQPQIFDNNLEHLDEKYSFNNINGLIESFNNEKMNQQGYLSQHNQNHLSQNNNVVVNQEGNQQVANTLDLNN